MQYRYNEKLDLFFLSMSDTNTYSTAHGRGRACRAARLSLGPGVIPRPFGLGDPWPNGPGCT